MDEQNILNEADTISTDKRKEITTMILKTLGYLDKGNKNVDKYEKFLNAFKTNKEFYNWLTEFLDSDENFYIEILPYDNEPELSEIKKAADYLNIPLEEYVVYNDESKPYTSKTPVSVGYLHLKRVQQILFKKNSYALDTSQRNLKTNQVTRDSKTARITDSENYALTTYGNDEALKEFFGPRADDQAKKMQMFKDIATQGYVNLKDLQSDLEDKQTLNTTDVYFLGLGINTDLVTPGLALKRTLKETKNRNAKK